MMLEDTSDSELIRRYLDNAPHAFDVLYGRYKRQLYAYLNRLIPGQSAVVDDIFQQTWIKAIRNLEEYRDSQKFLAWLMRISHNLAIDYFRRSRRRSMEIELDDERMLYSEKNQPWESLDNKELAGALEKCILKLNETQREVFLLRQEEMSFKEIAHIQNTSINTALGRMQYALRNLRNCMCGWDI
ncbi:MAG: sigma-70 family RNA polymerase sigma factor [Victivallales bacterium]|nr:sigma-70 family RNA polymerase sigma factor [Victivallales bacterium]